VGIKINIMSTKVHSVHFDADIKLVNFIHSKVAKLSQFFDNIVTSEVFLRLDKAQDKSNKVAEVRILLPGKELFAKKQSKTFEEATDLAVEALRRQVRRYKGKLADA
jgi:putative sigma-54 modulation protein